MLHTFKEEIIVKTPKHEFLVECYSNFIRKIKLEIRKEVFSDMCRTGCSNYDNKYCCPPFTPDFHAYVGDCSTLLVVLMKTAPNQLLSYGYNDYLKLRIANAVLKARIEKLMRSLESRFGRKFLGTGACRLCRPCQKKLNKSCKHPTRMRYSLESLGINCDSLSRKLFNIPLVWYKNGKVPEYTCVICALPVRNRIKHEIIEFIKNAGT